MLDIRKKVDASDGRELYEALEKIRDTRKEAENYPHVTTDGMESKAIDDALETFERIEKELSIGLGLGEFFYRLIRHR